MPIDLSWLVEERVVYWDCHGTMKVSEVVETDDE